jgi:hypothetical protein
MSFENLDLLFQSSTECNHSARLHQHTVLEDSCCIQSDPEKLETVLRYKLVGKKNQAKGDEEKNQSKELFVVVPLPTTTTTTFKLTITV